MENHDVIKYRVIESAITKTFFPGEDLYMLKAKLLFDNTYTEAIFFLGDNKNNRLSLLFENFSRQKEIHVKWISHTSIYPFVKRDDKGNPITDSSGKITLFFESDLFPILLQYNDETMEYELTGISKLPDYYFNYNIKRKKYIYFIKTEMGWKEPVIDTIISWPTIILREFMS